MTTITFDMERRHPAPAVPERFGPGRALRHAAAIAGRNLKHLVRNPMALVFIAFQPIMLVLLFNYVFGGAGRGRGLGRRRRCAERGVLGENGLLDPPELQAGSRPACSASARRTRW